ncbi:MAG: VOC family protein [Rhizomicrobium sp.]
MAKQATLPSRLHHNAYVTNDMEATRKFYEDVIGCRWSRPGAKPTNCSARFGPIATVSFALGDGGALAFFQFARPEDQKEFGPKMPFSPFHHIALNVDAETQKAIEERIRAAGYKEPDTYVLEHGYCRSVYITDPNGLTVEFTLDAPKADEINAERRAKAREELRKWLAGDHTTNNTYRAEHH